MNATIELPTRLSVLDDEDDVVEGLDRRLSKCGFEVERVIPPTATMEDTINEVLRVSEAALCDHHLRGGHKVDFSGAELVAALTDRGFPAVLFTGVLPAERYAIRRNMSRIPAFLLRENGLGNKRVVDALTDSVAEVREGRRPLRRRGRRTPVTIVGSRLSGSERLVEAVVSGWPGTDPIEIPADLLASQWASAPHEAVGRTFFATVNLGESDADQLFFENFEAESLETEEFLGVSSD